jgi:hypothetical protein
MRNAKVLDNLDWFGIRHDHYKHRAGISQMLRNLYENGNELQFCKLGLGISDPLGNYSASDHLAPFGPQILAASENSNAIKRVCRLAGDFMLVTSGHDVRKLIRNANLKYLKIAIGSELSCMVNPRVCWVCNTRTIWTDIASRSGIKEANEQLLLYRQADVNSRMAYDQWAALHENLPESLLEIAARGDSLAKGVGVTPDPIKYIWADCIASALYSAYHTNGAS